MEEAGQTTLVKEADVEAIFTAFYTPEYLRMLNMRDPNIVEYMWIAFANGWKCRGEHG